MGILSRRLPHKRSGEKSHPNSWENFMEKECEESPEELQTKGDGKYQRSGGESFQGNLKFQSDSPFLLYKILSWIGMKFPRLLLHKVLQEILRCPFYIKLFNELEWNLLRSAHIKFFHGLEWNSPPLLKDFMEKERGKFHLWKEFI